MRIKKIQIFILFFYLFFGMFGVLISNYFIETGQYYIVEQAKYGENVGSTLIYLFWMIYSFLFLNYAIKIYKRKIFFLKNIKNRKKGSQYYFCLIIICFFIGFIIIKGFIIGFPLLTKTDRYFFWGAQGGVFKILYGQLFILSLLAGVIYFNNRMVSIFFLFVILIIHIFFSNKFSALFLSLYVYIIPIFLSEFNNIKKKQFIICLVISIILFSVVLVNAYINIYNVLRIEDIFNAIILRIVLQGHLFWGTIENVNNFVFFNIHIFTNELLSIVDMNQSLSGMNGVMVDVSGNMGLARIEQGAQFTMAYPSTIFKFSGIVGMFVAQTIYISYFIFLLSLLKSMLLKNRILSIIPLGKILIDVIGYFGIGDLKLLFSIEQLLYWILYIVINLIYFVRKESNDENCNRLQNV